MNRSSVKKLGRRKAGTWGAPHKSARTSANRGTRAVLKRLLRGGRSQLVREE